MKRVASTLRLALFDMRGSLKRFVVLIACVALGVATIAAVGSVGGALQDAIDRDARVILGGDLEISADIDATPAEREVMENLGAVARVVTLNARALAGDRSVYISVQAVSERYPLVGQLEIVGPGTPIPAATAPLLENRNGRFGAVVDAQVLSRLGLVIGDPVRIGNLEFEVRAALATLPDQAGQNFQLGLPVLVADAALGPAGLDQPGVLTRFRYKIALQEPGYYAARAELRRFFPADVWRIRSPQDATETLESFFSLFARFLVLVGLSSLLVGGVGVSNAVTAYVNDRQGAIATLRSLGATRARIFFHFLFQIMVLSIAGIVLGLVAGGSASVLLLPLISSLMAIDLPPTLDIGALATAAGFGLLIALGFSLLPLRRAQTLRPAALFRAGGGGVGESVPTRTLLGRWTLLALGASFAGIAALALVTTGEPLLVFWYGVGAVVGFAVLRGAAHLLQQGARRLPPPSSTLLRNAMRALYRPGAPAPIVVLSLGMGLSLLLMIALLDGNIRDHLAAEIAQEAPDFVLIDMTAADTEAVGTFVWDDPDVIGFETVPMLRGTFQTVAGRDASSLPRTGTQGVLRGDTPLSWAREMPGGGQVVEGEWWPPDYMGAPLVSLDSGLKEGLGVEVGDTLTLAIAGRPLEMTIANFREIDWRHPGFNFQILVSPGLIEAAPQNRMGSLNAAPGTSAAVENRLGQAFPALNFVPVGEVLDRVNGVLGSLSNAVALVGGIAVVSGVLVLAGAISVGRRQREADAMVMKVLGATRRDIVTAYVVEYGVLGALAGLLALGLGIVGAWAILTHVLELGFTLEVPLVLVIVGGAVAATIGTGMVTTWTALSVRPAAQLRAE